MTGMTWQWSGDTTQLQWRVAEIPECAAVIPLQNMLPLPAPLFLATLESFRPWWPDILRAEAIVHQGAAPEQTVHAHLRPMMEQAQQCVTATHACGQPYQALMGRTVEPGAVLFLIPDDSVVLALMAQAGAEYKARPVFVIRFATGFNKSTRRFEPVADHLLPELLPWLLDNRVTTIVSHNTYYLDRNMQRGIFPLPIFRALGMEWISCDFDTYEGHFFQQQMVLHEPSFRRFAVEPHNQHDWCALFAMTPSAPIPVRVSATIPDRFTHCAPESPLVMVSNARLPDLLAQWNRVGQVMQRMRPTHAYYDATMWYYALRRVIIRENAQANRMRVDWVIGELYALYLNLLTFLKYDLLDQLAGRYPVQLYGDPAWGEVFPTLYQQRYLSEADYGGIFGGGQAIGLLANQNFSYVANNPTFVRALELSAPFVCHESIVSTDEFAPFRALEYGDADQLLEKLPRLNDLCQSPEMVACRQRYAAMHRDFLTQFSRHLMGPRDDAPLDTQFARNAAAHDVLWYAKVDEYIAIHRQQLYDDFVLLFTQPTPVSFVWDHSRYAGRPFVQRVERLQREMGGL